MKKLSFLSSVVGFFKTFLRFGVLFRSLPVKVTKKVYSSSCSLPVSMVFIRHWLAVLILKLFYRRLITQWKLNRNFSVTRTRSSYGIWSLNVRASARHPLSRSNKYLPARLKITESYQPLRRKDNDRARIPLIVYVPFILLYLVYGQRPYDAPLVGSYFPTPTITVTGTYEPTLTPRFSLSTSTPGYVVDRSGYGYHDSGTPTPGLSDTGFPFSFPVITDQGSFYSSVNKVLFSYYYPDLGGVNCHEDNWVNGHCKDTTASGESWKFYLSKGLAIHPDMFRALPYGSIIYVLSPESLRGFHTVIDLCGGCLINGNYYFDFLLPDMPLDVTWSDPVYYGIIRIGWDGEIPSPTPVPTWTLTSVPTVTHTLTQTSFPVSPTWTPTETPVPVSPTWTPTPSLVPDPPTETPVPASPTWTPIP